MLSACGRDQEQSVQLFPPLHQGTKLASQAIPEISLERLVPFVEFLAAWKLLPNTSQWVLQTIEKGYRIQFGSRPPGSMGSCPQW